AAHLPDAGVRFFPALGGGVDQADEEAPVVVVGRAAHLVPLPRQVEQIAEHVELQLLGGGVADADGRRPLVPLELRELELDEATLAARAVHDLQVLGAARGAAFDEAPEAVGLLLEAELTERSHSELSVAHPAVAVVPVATMADG